MAAPYHVNKAQLKIFTQWLRDRGADVLAPMNQWELIRFVANEETSVLYTQKSGRLTWTGETEKAWDCFKGKGQWMPGTAKKRKPKGQYIEALIRRDGPTCWYCRTMLDFVEMTTEHLVARSSGGPHHMDNLVIACQPCNERAHTMSVPEKIILREQIKEQDSGS